MVLRRRLLTVLGGGGAAGASLPYSISGLAADFDADDLLASLADTDPVTTWTDATGNGNDVGNTGTNRPTLDAVDPSFKGHASVLFAKASSQYLFSSSAPIITTLSGSDKPCTVFVVCRRHTKTTANEYVWSFGNSAGTTPYHAGLYQNSSNAQRFKLAVSDGTESEAQGAAETTDLGPQVLFGTFSGTSMSSYVVGGSQNPRYDAATAQATTDYSARGSMTFNRFAVGCLLRSTAAGFADLRVARVLVYDRELSAAESARVSNYLYDRYIRFTGTDTYPDWLLDSLIHSYSASSTLNAPLPGEGISGFSDVVGGKSLSAPLSANRPMLREDATGYDYAEFDGTNDYVVGDAAADWTFLHDGTDYTLALVYRPKSAASALTPMVDTVDNATATKNGIGIYHDAASGAHSIQVKIGASNATPVLNHDSQDYGSRPDAWHVLIVTREGTHPSTEEDYTITLDNELYAASDQGVAPAAGAPTHPLTLGALGGLGTFGRFDFKALDIFDRKLGRPGELQTLAEILARIYDTSHVALVGGNGFANTLNDTEKHRGFPAICQDASGTFHVVYRRGSTHGSSRGVGVQVSSGDGITWSAERVVYDVDDSDGQDWRGGCSLIRLRYGSHAGRLLQFTNWATDTSGLEVSGFASTNLLGISDDNGGSWEWSNPQENDSKNVYENPWDYTVANAGCLIELSTGRILMTFTSKDASENTDNQDLNLSYSDDGGETWSDSVIIALHDVCFNNQLNKRVTESWIIEWDDGGLTMFVRNDTDLELWRATADISDVTTWAFESAKMFDGSGRPMAIRDPDDAESCYIFYRSDPGAVTVWRHSTDRGATWSAERAFSNLHSTTTIAQYNEMSYVHATTDADGNIWLAYGLEAGDDSDVFVRRWTSAE